MNHPKIFDSYGDFSIGFHEGVPVVVHSQFDCLRVYDLKNLSEISRAAFQMPIVDVSVLPSKEDSPLRFVVITEDKNAHLITLVNKKFKVHSSTNLGGNNIMHSHIVLTDRHSYRYILFENGNVIKFSRKTQEAYTIEWPNKNARVIRLMSTKDFEGQRVIARDSAAFLAYQKTDNGCEIASLIFDFSTKKVIEGPYTISISPQSISLNSQFFFQNSKLFSVNPYQEAGEFNDIVCCSTSSCVNETAFFTTDGICYKAYIEDGKVKIDELTRLSNPPIRCEVVGDDLVYLTYDGQLVSKNSKASLKLSAPFMMNEYKSILIRCSQNEIKPFPVYEFPPPKIINATVKNSTIKGITGAEWKAPAKIVTYSGYTSDDSDFIIAATAASIHILKFSKAAKKVSVVKEETLNSPVIAVAISATNYAISTIENGVQVMSYKENPFNLSFHTGQCLCLSLSETTVASGFDDGSFILASLEERGPIINIKPFNTPVKSVQHNDDNSVIVEWGETIALVSKDSLKWLKLPTFRGAIVSSFASDMLALGAEGGLAIYNFPTNKLTAVIPRRVVGICSSSVCFSTLGSLGIRFFTLTVNNELVVLYSHRGIDVDHQSIIDAEDPFAISAVDENAYVLCKKYVAIYDMRGNRIDTVEFPSPPRFFEAASRGLYIAFSRMVWYISRDQSMKKIPHDRSNITCFAAVDDDRFCISTSSRIIICSSVGAKVSFNTLAKIDKKVLSMKSFASKQNNVVDSLFVVFDDESTETISIPDVE